MIITIDEAKKYLRLETDIEDTLIEGFIISAEEICESILRYPLTDFKEVPQTVKQAVLFIVSNMYEKREEVDLKEIVGIVKGFLFSYRKEEW